MRAIDLSDNIRLRLIGPDAARYLNGQITNDVGLCKDRQGIAACVCNAKGKLDGVVNVSPVEGGFLVDFTIDLADTLPLRLDKYLIADNCEWEDVSAASAQYFLADTTPGEAGEWLKDSGATVVAQWRFGNRGCDVFCPKEKTAGLLTLLSEHHATFLSFNEIEVMRIENLSPQWGAELDHETLPQEAGLENTHISFSKGCYIGQETISRIKSVGRVNRRLVRIAPLSLPAFLEPGHPIYPAGFTAGTKPVGSLTTVLGDGPSLAYLHRSVLDGQTPLVVYDSEKSLSRPIRILQTADTN